jgi:hypothetical protein
MFLMPHCDGLLSLTGLRVRSLMRWPVYVSLFSCFANIWFVLIPFSDLGMSIISYILVSFQYSHALSLFILPLRLSPVQSTQLFPQFEHFKFLLHGLTLNLSEVLIVPFELIYTCGFAFPIICVPRLSGRPTPPSEVGYLLFKSPG